MRIEKVGMTPLSFGKKLEEHRSWGARVATDDNKKENSSFKIYVYPDTKGVVAGVIKSDGSKREYELQNKGKGVFEKQIFKKAKFPPAINITTQSIKVQAKLTPLKTHTPLNKKN